MATTVLWTLPNPVSPLIFRGNKKLFCTENGPGIYPISFASLSRLGVLLDAGEFITLRNVSAPDAGGWKSKMEGQQKGQREAESQRKLKLMMMSTLGIYTHGHSSDGLTAS